MNKTLVYASGASQGFGKLPNEVQEAIFDALLLYGLTGKGDVSRMKGSRNARLRVGSYRVVFEESRHTLTIIAVGHRREIYR